MVPDESREWLEAMLLIRRFEERAGAMYAKNKVGGFLRLIWVSVLIGSPP